MSKSEFDDICTNFFDNIRKGIEMCKEMKSKLDDDIKNNRITYAEWEDGMKEYDGLTSFLESQLKEFRTSLNGIKKV